MQSHWGHLKKLMPELASYSILDLGCGRGRFLLEAAQYDADVIGLEFNPLYIAEAEQAGIQEGKTLRIIEGRGEALPFKDASFDFVNMSEVIEHVEDPSAVLNEVYRVLKPQGFVYISIPNRFGFRDPHYHIYFVNWIPRAWSDTFISLFGTHKEYDDLDAGQQRLKEMHYYTYGGSTRLAQASGFKMQDIRTLRIKKEMRGQKLLAASAVYPVLRTLYFDSFHLLLQRPAAPAR